jgi:hypothetical protein
MPTQVATPFDLPIGGHGLSLHASREEAAEHAVDFLAGAPSGQPAVYWVGDASLVPYYDEKLAAKAPAQVGCVRALDHEQVDSVDGRLRPTPEVVAYLREHGEGTTAGADTLSLYWTPETMPEHLEYEAWFDEQPRDASRFLCPYDLRRVPAEKAPEILRELGRHHSHVVLSDAPEPAVRLLQLFVFATPAELPVALRESLLWAAQEGLVKVLGPHEEFLATPKGVALFRNWARQAQLDW